MADLGPAVETILHQCLAVEPGETVVVVGDTGTQPIGAALGLVRA